MSGQQQFTDHYHQVKDQLFTFLMVRLNYNTAVAEDLLMDVVLRAYEKFDRFDENKGSFKTWIFTIAYRLLMNAWRDQKKTVSLDFLEGEGLYLATTDFKDDTDLILEQGRISDVLSRLTDGDRELISMKYFQDLDYSEMEIIMGRKQGAIRTSLSRALKRFESLYRKIYS